MLQNCSLKLYRIQYSTHRLCFLRWWDFLRVDSADNVLKSIVTIVTNFLVQFHNLSHQDNVENKNSVKLELKPIQKAPLQTHLLQFFPVYSQVQQNMIIFYGKESKVLRGLVKWILHTCGIWINRQLLSRTLDPNQYYKMSITKIVNTCFCTLLLILIACINIK